MRPQHRSADVESFDPSLAHAQGDHLHKRHFLHGIVGATAPASSLSSSRNVHHHVAIIGRRVLTQSTDPHMESAGSE